MSPSGHYILTAISAVLAAVLAIRAPHVGIGAHPSSARAHDRAGRRALARRRAMGCLALQLPGARQRAGAYVPGQAAGVLCVALLTRRTSERVSSSKVSKRSILWTGWPSS